MNFLQSSPPSPAHHHPHAHPADSSRLPTEVTYPCSLCSWCCCLVRLRYWTVLCHLGSLCVCFRCIELILRGHGLLLDVAKISDSLLVDVVSSRLLCNSMLGLYDRTRSGISVSSGLIKVTLPIVAEFL